MNLAIVGGAGSADSPHDESHAAHRGQEGGGVLLQPVCKVHAEHPAYHGPGPKRQRPDLQQETQPDHSVAHTVQVRASELVGVLCPTLYFNIGLVERLPSHNRKSMSQSAAYHLFDGPDLGLHLFEVGAVGFEQELQLLVVLQLTLRSRQI